MKTFTFLSFLFIPVTGIALAQNKAVIPAGVKIVGPYSPGVLAGDSLYVAGMGAQRADGAFPSTPAEQLRQCLENIRTVVEAAGLTMDHLVYAEVYVKDPGAFGEIDRAWAAYFPRNGPARSMIGVASLPVGTPVEVNAVAIRDLSQKRAVTIPAEPETAVPPAVFAGDRLYISDCRGADSNGAVPSDPSAQVAAALDRMGKVLKAAKLGFANMVFVNPFMTRAIGYGPMNHVYASHFEFGNTPARATIFVASLPAGVNIEYTGVAVTDLARRRAVRPKNMEPSPTASPCVFAGDVFYCSAKSAFIPGPQSGVYASSVEEQVRQTMRNLLDGLEEAGLSFADVVSTNVYLDDVADFSKMNSTYKLFFGAVPPARTTVQQVPSVERKANAKDQWPDLEQISLIAVRH